MNAPSSRPPDERFAEWVDGCMSQRDRERFEAELRVNAALRADLAAYERTVATLREALQAPTAPTNLADRVLNAVQAASPAASGAPGPRKHRSFGAYLFGGLAAAGLMAVAVWFDAWVAPTGQVDKVAQVDPVAVGTPPPGAVLDKGSAGTKPAADAPAAEKGAEPGGLLHLDAEAAKVAPGDAEDAESKKEVDAARDNAVGRDKSEGADAKPKGQFGSRGEPEPLATAGGLPETPSVGSAAAGGEVREPEADKAVPAPAAPVAPSQPMPGAVVGGVREAAEPAPRDRGGAKPDAAGELRDQPRSGQSAPGAPAGGANRPRSPEGSPAGERRGAASPSPATAAPIVGPLPLLTVERKAPPTTVPSPAGEEAKDQGEERRARFAEDTQADLTPRVDRFLATAGAGLGDEVVWRTPRGALVLRAVDPALLVRPEEGPARRADSAVGGGGGAPGTPRPLSRAWLIVGDAADIEVLLARLGTKVRADGWRLQTGEFEGPKPPQGSGSSGPAAGQSGAQRSLLLHFRFVR